jgi:regulator of sigma E protease
MDIKRAIQQDQTPLGIYFQISTVVVRHGFTRAFDESIVTNSQFALMIFDTLGSLFKGEASLKHLEGPLGLVRLTGQAADHSLAALVGLMALISVNLGIMNLLPIPILDGGTMLLSLIEALRGRDLSLFVKERILQAGLVALLIVFVVAVQRHSQMDRSGNHRMSRV